MTTSHEWDRWEESWRAARSSQAELDGLVARTQRARRGCVLVRMLSTALTVAALAVVAAALRHAGNPVEASLGLVVAAGIVAVWLANARNQRRDGEQVEAAAIEYRAARRDLCGRQIRFARLAWIVIALDLVFLVPWWIGGISVHGARFSVTQVLTIWGPLVVMAGVIAWTIRLHRSARGELARAVEDGE